MPPDVLPHRQQLAVGVEQGGRMQPAGFREQLLALLQAVGKRQDRLRDTFGPSPSGGTPVIASWSSDAFPQTPQPLFV